MIKLSAIIYCIFNLVTRFSFLLFLLSLSCAVSPKRQTASYYKKLANEKFKTGDFTGSINDYTNAIKQDSRDALAYTNRGIAKSKIKDFSGAIDDYNKAIELNPNQAEAYNNIGDVNLGDNWGNTIIIKHGDYLFSKISHIKEGSFKVRVGDYVKKGDVLAVCGNSGRSPEPHLHFQLQSKLLSDSV